MPIYIYESANGRLYSYCPTDDSPVASDEVLAEKGLSKAIIASPMDETHVWDEATRTIVEVPAPVRPREIPTSRFVLAFTATELEAVRNSTDPVVKQLWIAATVVPEVDMHRQSTIDGVGYLELIGLIGEGRAAEILATE